MPVFLAKSMVIVKKKRILSEELKDSGRGPDDPELAHGL